MFNTVILLVLACTDRATLSAIVYFEWSPPRAPLENDARATLGKLPISWFSVRFYFHYFQIYVPPEKAPAAVQWNIDDSLCPE